MDKARSMVSLLGTSSHCRDSSTERSGLSEVFVEEETPSDPDLSYLLFFLNEEKSGMVL